MYNLGCAYALTGHPDKAFEALALSQKAGFAVGENAPGDADLKSLREDPRFAALLESAPARPRRSGGMGGGMGDMGDMADFQSMMEQVMVEAQMLIEEIAPKAEQHIGAIIETAVYHLQKLAEELHKILANDERFGTLSQILEEWMGAAGGMGGMEMGGMSDGGHGHASEHGHEHAMESEHGHEHAAEGKQDGKHEASSRPSADAGEVKAIVEKARAYQERGDWVAAVQAFEKAVKLDPESAAAWFGLTYSLHMAGDYDAAIGAHTKAATFEEIEGISMYNLACAYALTGHTEEAIEALVASWKAGFEVLEPMQHDSDLDSLRDNRQFKRLMRDIERDGDS
jgi:tetratricopeptide (TPR) repeat protein